MAAKFTTESVISFFDGEDRDGLAEVIFDGSDDELGMEDEVENDSEPDFEPLDLIDEGCKEIYCIL